MESQEYSTQSLKRIMTYAEGNKGKILKAVLFIFFSVLSGIVAYILVYPIIKALIGQEALEMNMLLRFSAGICGAGIMKAIFFNKGLEASHEAAYAILYKMRVKIAEKMTRMPLGDVQSRGAGSFKRKTVDDIESIEIILAHMVPEGLPYLIAPIIIYTIIFIVDWRLGLLAIGSLPFGIIPMGIMMIVGLKRMPKAYEATDKMNRTIVEYVNGMDVIKIFGRSADAYDRYASAVHDYKKYNLDWWRVSWPWMAIFTVLLPATIMFMLPFGLKMYIGGTLSLDKLVFSVLIALSLGDPLVKLLRLLPAIPQLAQRLTEMEKIYDNKELDEDTLTPNFNKYDIQFKHVSFAYDEKEVIQNISFQLLGGSMTAIVGESGSGKSTLAKLLVHLWDVKDGTITIDGIDIRDMSVEYLMGQIAFVDQDNFLYNMTLMDNIRLGDLKASDEAVIEASKLAQCHQFISQLDKGYDTLAGDAGTKLSGGQRQRITLARAILKDAPIVVLDEATAYADPENEHLIQKALTTLTENKTLIVIAHRLSTIVHANKILVMDQGQLAGEGRHDDLLKKNATYKKLWTAHVSSMAWYLQTSEEEEVHHA